MTYLMKQHLDTSPKVHSLDGVYKLEAAVATLLTRTLQPDKQTRPMINN